MQQQWLNFEKNENFEEMPRSKVFKELEKIEDPKDHSKILSYLHYTHFFLLDKYKKVLLEYGLTPSQSNVLGIVDHFYPDSISLEGIKEWMLEPNSDVSRIVRRLVEKGLLEKVINKENRRKVSIKITPKGKKIVGELLKEKKFQKFTSKLSLAEAKTFVSVLSKLRATEI